VTTEAVPIAAFLKELMLRRGRLPSQLAADLGVSHATVSRWLSGSDTPSIGSWRKLAEYSDLSLEKILRITGYLPKAEAESPANWPDFREYALRKYPNELDEDLVAAIEGLIMRRRQNRSIEDKK